MSKYLKSSLIISACLLAATSFAKTKPFFEVGKSYLIVPRIDVVKHCQLAQLTPQEAVFKNCSVLKGTRNAGMKKALFIEKFVNMSVKKRGSLLEKNGLKRNVLVSYSRGNLTAIKLN